MEATPSTPAGHSAFPTTQWTVIVEVSSQDSSRAAQALEKLCSAYRQPIVNWFRRKDFRQDPEDLAHGFVAYLIKNELWKKATPRTGRFRAFLAATLQNFLRDSWDKVGAQKRGGGTEKVCLDEQQFAIESSDGNGDSPLDIDLALVIHRRVMEALAPRPKLKPYIFFKDSSEGWEEIAARDGKSAVALRQEVTRLRRSHWEMFRNEVAHLVVPNMRDEETRYLYELLFRNLPAD